MFMPYFKLSALSKCCLVLSTTSEMSQLLKLGEKRVKFCYGKLQPAFIQESKDIITLSFPRDEGIFTLLAAQTALDMTLEEGSSL